MSQAGSISVAGGGGATSFVEDVGAATPVAGVINILGGTGVTTTGAGNTVTISLSGGGVAVEHLTGTTGGQLNPDINNNFNLLAGVVAAGTTPVAIAGSGSTLTTNIQTSQAIAAADATKIGLSNFDSGSFAVAATGFVTLAGTGALKTLTGNSGGAISPTANNINTVGTGSITIAGAGSTLTTQLTGLTNHAVLVGAGSATITNVGPTATAGQILQSAGAAADPVFSTATYPSTTTVSQLLYSSSANVVAGLATANSATLVTTSTGVPVMSATMTNGQVIIGSTGATPAASTLSAGTGISITNGAGTITIAGTGGALTWINQTIDLSPLVAGNAYEANKGTLLTLTLPTGGTFGQTIRVQGFGAGGWIINAGVGQTIQVNANASTVAGSVASTNRYDYIELVCSTTTTTWLATDSGGNLTLA